MFYCSQPNKPLTTLAKKDLEDLIAQASYGDKIETVRATQTVRFFSFSSKIYKCIINNVYVIILVVHSGA